MGILTTPKKRNMEKNMEDYTENWGLITDGFCILPLVSKETKNVKIKLTPRY